MFWLCAGVEFQLFLTSCYHRKKLQEDRKLLSLNICQLEDSVYRARPALCTSVRVCLCARHAMRKGLIMRKTILLSLKCSNMLYYYCIKIVLGYERGLSCQVYPKTDNKHYCGNKTFFAEDDNVLELKCVYPIVYTNRDQGRNMWEDTETNKKNMWTHNTHTHYTMQRSTPGFSYNHTHHHVIIMPLDNPPPND